MHRRNFWHTTWRPSMIVTSLARLNAPLGMYLLHSRSHSRSHYPSSFFPPTTQIAHPRCYLHIISTLVPTKHVRKPTTVLAFDHDVPVIPELLTSPVCLLPLLLGPSPVHLQSKQRTYMITLWIKFRSKANEESLASTLQSKLDTELSNA